MAAVPEPLLMTVEQYRQLPRRDDVLQELRWGKVFDLTRPKMKHAKIQSRLVRLLRPKIEHLGVVESEVAFRALPEYDLRGADVAVVSQKRWEETPDDDNLRGSPEIVIEILSPSNTKSEMREKSALYLSTGALQFWIVDAKNRAVTVMQRGGSCVLYAHGEVIPLTTFVAGSITVDQIFD
jgi:Uma2 family endonuclease